MGICSICKKEKPFLSKVLKVCLDCIREKPKDTLPFIKKAHQEARERYNLPVFFAESQKRHKM